MSHDLISIVKVKGGLLLLLLQGYNWVKFSDHIILVSAFLRDRHARISIVSLKQPTRTIIQLST
jgi:hypothetical protein